MPLQTEANKRAEGVGYYTTYGSDAADILGYLSSDLRHVEEDRPTYYSGQLFKVTVIVEEI